MSENLQSSISVSGNTEAAAEALRKVLDHLAKVAVNKPEVASADRLFFPNGIELITASAKVAGVEISLTVAGPKPSTTIAPGADAVFADAAATTFELLPQISGNGYYSYEPAANQFGTPQTIATIVDVGSTFQLNQPTLPFGVGDISLRNGGPMPGHTTGHQQGRNVDIRLMRKDRRPMGTNINDSANYDRDATKLVIDSFLAHANVSFILFNDASIPNVRPAPNHDDHFHVQMRA